MNKNFTVVFSDHESWPLASVYRTGTVSYRFFRKRKRTGRCLIISIVQSLSSFFFPLKNWPRCDPSIIHTVDPLCGPFTKKWYYLYAWYVQSVLSICLINTCDANHSWFINRLLLASKFTLVFWQVFDCVLAVHWKKFWSWVKVVHLTNIGMHVLPTAVKCNTYKKSREWLCS
jgi:hypothetical protein